MPNTNSSETYPAIILVWLLTHKWNRIDLVKGFNYHRRLSSWSFRLLYSNIYADNLPKRQSTLQFEHLMLFNRRGNFLAADAHDLHFITRKVIKRPQACANLNREIFKHWIANRIISADAASCWLFAWETICNYFTLDLNWSWSEKKC